MQRDLSLIRALAQEIAKSEDGWAPSALSVEGYSKPQIDYHLLLMLDAGLVTGTDTTSFDESPNAVVGRLTWAGHEFLDASAEPMRWEKALAAVQRAGGATFPVVMEKLTELAAKAVLD